MIDVVDADGALPPRYRRLLGEKTGVLNRIRYTPPDRGAPESYVSVPTMGDLGVLTGTDGFDADLGVCGKGRTVARSFERALGEAVERYCLCWPDRESDLERGTHAEMDRRGPVVDFDVLDAYDGEWLAPLERSTELYWTRATELSSGEEWRVPAECVWFGTGPLADEPRHVPTSSNGCATGRTLREALVGAVYELVERDAFMRTWCRQTPPPRVPLTEYTELRDVISDLRPGRSTELRAYRLPSPVEIPTVCVTARSEGDDWPAFLVSAAAAGDRRSALEEALVEIAQGCQFVDELRARMGDEAVGLEDLTAGFDENVHHYASPETEANAEFLREEVDGAPDAAEEIAAESHREELSALVRRFDREGFDLVGTDLTTVDVGDVGLRVVRVLAPGLVDLSPPATFPTGHPAFDGEAIDPPPHPFP